METLNNIFFAVWYFFDEFLFFIWAFFILLSLVFCLVYQIWKRPA